MKKLFGTDGIRGKANAYPITPEIALQVGKAIAHVFGARGHGSARAVVGKDTRLSGYMIETALTSGLVSMGMDVLAIGPLPTPAIAHLIRSMGAACGIMITASHNPSDDNGIKIFGADGFKLPDEIELDIEKHVLGIEINSEHINTSLLGKAYRIDDAAGRYIEFAKSSIKNHRLHGFKIVLDCANGAAYKIAPFIFSELGAEIIEIGTKPDGYNINYECGATHTDRMAKMVRKHKADIGVALDGDADRVIFCDAKGNVVNGDRIIAMCALNFKEHGKLVDDTVVVTSMTNLGFHEAMSNAGINVVITDVGDRYVIEQMQKFGYNIGGEQSGHIIFMDYVTTGDGIITALHILKMMLEKQQSLENLAKCMNEFPQLLTNISVKRKIPIKKCLPLSKVIKECNHALGENGRTIVRYSGTEKKIRILVEASNESEVKTWSKKITTVVKKELC